MRAASARRRSWHSVITLWQRYRWCAFFDSKSPVPCLWDCDLYRWRETDISTLDLKPLGHFPIPPAQFKRQPCTFDHHVTRQWRGKTSGVAKREGKRPGGTSKENVLRVCSKLVGLSSSALSRLRLVINLTQSAAAVILSLSQEKCLGMWWVA